MNTDIKTQEAFFQSLENKSKEEIKQLMTNLKHIGYSDEKIQEVTEEYYNYFQKLHNDKAQVTIDKQTTTTS